MTKLTPTGGNFNAVMSSREIADLCDKRHDHILRDIEKMIRDIADPRFGVSDFLGSYQDATGRSLKEYRLPKDLTVTLITGYRADLRYKVVKRLEELEANPHQIPQTMSEALQLAADQSKQIETMKGDVAALDQIAKADGSYCVTDAAKNLGMRPKDLFQWLNSNGWIYKRAGCSHWLGYQTHCNRGDLEHKTTTVLRADGSEKITEQVRITAQGLTKLAKLIPPTISEAA